MTQPPDAAALVARLKEADAFWRSVEADRTGDGRAAAAGHAALAAEAATALEAKDRRIEALEAALEKLSISDVPRSDDKKWRADGLYSKPDQCAHGVAMYEDCTGCIENFARAALEPSDKGVGA